jgi:hypothetical protein
MGINTHFLFLAGKRFAAFAEKLCALAVSL